MNRSFQLSNKQTFFEGFLITKIVKLIEIIQKKFSTSKVASTSLFSVLINDTIGLFMSSIANTTLLIGTTFQRFETNFRKVKDPLLNFIPNGFKPLSQACQTQIAVRATLLFLKREKSSVGCRFKIIEKNYFKIIFMLIIWILLSFKLFKFIYSLQIGQMLSFFDTMQLICKCFKD